MSNADIPIKIEFIAEAGNVKQTTEQLRKDLENLGKPGSGKGFAPQVDLQRAQADLRKLASAPLDLKLNLPSAADEMAELAKDFKSVQLEVPLNEQKIRDELSQMLKGFGSPGALPPLELPVKIPKPSNAELTAIKSSLNGTLEIPGLQSRSSALVGVLQQLDAWKAANADLLQSDKALESQFRTLTESASGGLKQVAADARSLAGLAGICS